MDGAWFTNLLASGVSKDYLKRCGSCLLKGEHTLINAEYFLVEMWRYLQQEVADMDKAVSRGTVCRRVVP